MFSKKANKPPSRIDSLIGAGTSVSGDVTYSGGLRVDGEVRGNVIAVDDKPGSLVMSERAYIEGEIQASYAVINGKVNGTIRVTGHLELQSKARVTGDVCYQTLEVHLGAIVQGRLVNLDSEKSDKVVAFKPAP
ncbi:MAG: polymer-forming cytoskeletal protein [Pseudomonadota bacterium]